MANTEAAPIRLSSESFGGALGKSIHCVCLVGVVVVVYLSSFDGTFLFDDKRFILQNPHTEQLWPPWAWLSVRRPVVELSLAVNRAVGGMNLWGYHAFNLIVHVLATLTLWGIAVRTLSREPLRTRFGRAAPYLALATAAIWAVHPLQTQSVTYLTQRCESMMGLFFLLTLYGMIRGADSSRPTVWSAVAVACCALGMGCKGVMASAPVLVLLYDRCFGALSTGAALRSRGAFYVGLAGTWSVLIACGVARAVLSPSTHRAAVGFGFTAISPIEYVSTQPGVLLRYLMLCLWPSPLCLDYGWPVARTFGSILCPGLIVALLAIGTIWTLLRRPRLGFLGAWVFLILAPTSSIIPIRDPLFEHRMYLPLAAAVVLAVIGGYLVLERLGDLLKLEVPRRGAIGITLALIVAMLLGFATHRRNKEYTGELMMWRDVVGKRPLNARGRYNLGSALLKRGELQAARSELEEALRIDPLSVEAHYNLGKVLSRRGESEHRSDLIIAAVEHFEAALRINPRLARAHNDLGNIHARRGRDEEAILRYREAIRVRPDYARAYYNLSNVLLTHGRINEAIGATQEAAALDAGSAPVRYLHGEALRRGGRFDEAQVELRAALERDPNLTLARRALEAAIAKRRDLLALE